jgi:TPR repeat protein
VQPRPVYSEQLLQRECGGLIRLPQLVFIPANRRHLLLAECRSSPVVTSHRPSRRTSLVGDDMTRSRVLICQSDDLGWTWLKYRMLTPVGYGSGVALYDRLRSKLVLQYQQFPEVDPYAFTTLLQIYHQTHTSSSFFPPFSPPAQCNFSLALQYFSSHADQDPDCQAILGILNFAALHTHLQNNPSNHGSTTTTTTTTTTDSLLPIPNKRLALYLWKSSSERGSLLGTARHLYHSLCDFERAFYLFLLLAKAGVILAQNSVARCYQNGVGTSVNYQEALRWYLKAANDGYVLAQYNLADLYRLGYTELGLLTEAKLEAVRWYRMADEQGYSRAPAIVKHEISGKIFHLLN